MLGYVGSYTILYKPHCSRSHYPQYQPLLCLRQRNQTDKLNWENY